MLALLVPLILDVAIVAHKSDLPKLQASLDRYVEDVSRARGVKIVLLADRDWKTPPEVREALQKRPDLEGAILVGRLPLMRFRTTVHEKDYGDKDGNVGVCALYYEDLDATFEAKDGVVEEAGFKPGAKPGAEIWVSFIYPRAGLDEIVRFFEKTHRYYAGERKYNGRVLLWQTLEAGPTNADIRELEKVFKRSEIDCYGKDETTTENGKLALKRQDLTKITTLTPDNMPGWKYQKKDNPLVDQLRRLSGQYYDLYEVHYGGGYFHAYLLTDDVKKQKASPKIAALNACRTGQFDYDPARSIALAYLYDTDGTLAVMGPTVEASWSQLYNLIYRYMAEGDFLGRAWRRKDRLSELDETDVSPAAGPGKTTYHDHTLPTRGSALIGDPFVRLRN